MSDTQNETSFDAIFPSGFWEEVCSVVSDGVVIEEPFQEITVYENQDTDTYHGCVTAPLPELPEEVYCGDSKEDSVWENRKENTPVALDGDIGTAVSNAIQKFREQITVTTPGTGSVDVQFVRLLLEEGRVAAVFRVVQSLPSENALYDSFRELMVTLGHVDQKEKITHGHGLHPESWHDKRNSHDVDLGMAATAYKLIPDPHTYRSDCDTLQEYIDACVANGADREELESRDEFYFHFHPQTDYRELSSEEVEALAAWDDEIWSRVDPVVSVDEPVVGKHVTDVSFDEDGTGEVVLSVSLGDEFPDR